MHMPEGQLYPGTPDINFNYTEIIPAEQRIHLR